MCFSVKTNQIFRNVLASRLSDEATGGVLKKKMLIKVYQNSQNNS